MQVTLVRAKVKDDSVKETEAATRKMFAAIEKAKPEGVHLYGSFKLGDGVTFVALLALDDGVENPLPTIPEFVEFQQRLEGWRAEPPTVEPVTVVGSYGLV